MFTLSYNLNSEGAQLPKISFLEEHSTTAAFYAYISCQAVHKRLGNDCPKGGLYKLVFCLSAKCCRFKVSTEKQLPTEDDFVSL